MKRRGQDNREREGFERRRTRGGRAESIVNANPSCLSCLRVAEKEIAQVEREDFLGGSFAVARPRKIILEGSRSESSAAACRLPVYPSIYPFLLGDSALSLSLSLSLSVSLPRSRSRHF